MKANKVERKRKPVSAIAIGAILFFAAAAIGVTSAYAKLREIWTASCLVTDVTDQVTCTDGTMVKRGTILDRFGIRNGTNLADIDFDLKRREILRDIPNIRAISVTRRLPNRVDIAVEERRPVVRLAIHARPGVSGRVADTEGVVFTCRRGTGMLPTIREKVRAVTPVGQRLTGRALAALRLVETASDARFAALGILDADIAKQDFIVATLGDYATLKVAWDGMDDPTDANQTNLVVRLDQVLKTVKNTDSVGAGTKVWNATIPNRVFADTQETIL